MSIAPSFDRPDLKVQFYVKPDSPFFSEVQTVIDHLAENNVTQLNRSDIIRYCLARVAREIRNGAKGLV